MAISANRWRPAHHRAELAKLGTWSSNRSIVGTRTPDLSFGTSAGVEIFEIDPPRLLALASDNLGVR
jgi:hypothetical protein